MFKELKYIFFVVIIFTFIFFISKYYFSDTNKRNSHRTYNAIDNKIEKFSKKLNILENDTTDIIEYVYNKDNKNKKKYHFWKLLIND